MPSQPAVEKRTEGATVGGGPGERLKRRIINEAVPCLARGLLESRDLDEPEAALSMAISLVHRLLVRLFAEARGLCPRGQTQGPWDVERHVPELLLARVADSLSRDRHPATGISTEVDFGRLDIRLLGSIHEELLEHRLVPADGDAGIRPASVRLARDRSGRKATGSFYTPDTIVRYVVRHAVGPRLEEHLGRLAAARTAGAAAGEVVGRLFDFRVLDPAMGSGHLLAAAADFIAQRMAEFLTALGVDPFGPAQERGRAFDVSAAGGVSRLRPVVLGRCVYGVDLDPLAVELARMSLWLHAAVPGLPPDFMGDHLVRGDGLFDAAPWEPGATGSAGFDVVVGNPPHAGHRGDVDGKRLGARFRVCREQPNLATAFIERSLELVRPGGAVGLVVPKSVQYVSGWGAARRLVAREHRLERLADTSQAFDGVLLEQSVLIASNREPGDRYLGAELDSRGGERPREVSLALHDSLGCLPAAFDDRSIELYERIRRLGPRLGDVSETSQALGYQARLNREASGVHVPIYRGRHVRPMSVDPTEDWIDRAYLIRTGSDGLTAKVEAMLRPKVVTQNIIAHVTSPRPRVRIISAPDRDGVLCLNTISTTLVRDGRFPIDYVAAVLNSALASWFFSELVFCRGIRTMHFDGHYAGKLPLAELSRSAVHRFADLAGRCRAKGDPRGGQERIDTLVFDAYDLSERERSFIREYCYGTSGSPGGRRRGAARRGTFDAPAVGG